MASPFVAAMGDVSGWRSAWMPLAIAAASLSILGSVMLVMLSRLFDLKSLEQVAKTEFIYASSTVFIVIFAILLMQFGEIAGVYLAQKLFLTSLCSPNLQVTMPADTQTLMDYAKLYMSTPAKCTQDMMRVLYFMSIPLEAAASVFMEIFMSEHASGFGVKWLAERVTNTTQILTFYMFIYYLMMHLMEFIKYYGGFFFAVGVVLRAFPPTRGAGAYLMAIAIGLYFIFPLSYILISAMSLPQTQAGFECIGKDSAGTAAAVCNLPKIPEVKGCGSETMSSVQSSVLYLKQNYNKMTDIMNFEVFELVRHLTSAICIFPLVCMTIVLTFVLNMTNLFGGNIPEIGRGLVKLI